MNIVVAPVASEEIIKKSRFISLVRPCQTEREALLWIKQLYEQHPTASHVVYAYRIQSAQGLICRFNDAGEPSGTAGKPIFQHLEGKQLMNVAVAVIRYFGGIKLGAGGLTRAYGGAAKKALEIAEIKEFIELVELILDLDYSQMQACEYQLKKFDGTIVDQQFTEKVRLKVCMPKRHADAFKALFNVVV